MNKKKIILIILTLLILTSIPTFAATLVEITSPTGGQCFLQGSNISVSANVYDTVNGQVYSGIQWYYNNSPIGSDSDAQTITLGTVNSGQKQTDVIKAVYNGISSEEINIHVYKDFVYMGIDRASSYIKSLQTDNGSFGGYSGHYYLAASLGQAETDLKAFKTGNNTYIDYIKTLNIDSTTSAGELVKLIYTLASIEEDPANFNGKNLVRLLLDKQKADGSFGEGVFTDAFAVIALNKAGAAIPEQIELRIYFEGLSYSDGLFDYGGGWTDIDTTARIVRALKILGADNTHTVIKNALEAIKSAQSAGGAIESWGTANYDTTSEVVMMLADLVINPTQGDWDKNGKNLVTAILSNQDADGSFISSWDSKYSTYEALLALTKYHNTFGTPVNQDNGNSEPQQPSDPSTPPANSSSINVSVTVIGKNGQSLFDKSMATIPESSKFGKTALQALEQTGLAYKTKNDNLYVYEIAGIKEDISSTAGWKFKVNGVTPNTAAKNCTLNNGDDVVWFWVQSYIQDQPDSKYVEYNPEIIPASPEIIDSNEIQVVFIDVTDNKYGWAKDEIQYLAARGIVNGTGNGKYDPGKPITREEFIKIIISMMGEEIGHSVSLGFKDEAYISIWARSYIAKAKELGIINGYEDNSFKPKENITREEMTVILIRALIKEEKIELLPRDDRNLSFKDIETFSSWARNYISAAVHNNIVKGRADNLFDAKLDCIRAEAAVMVYRAMNIQ